jgi:formylglycine-generating enzyme required for sulfatase activity
MNFWGLFAFFVFMAHAQTHERIRLDDLGGIFIDKTEVTISQFAKFTKATGLTTQAELEGGGFEFVAGWQRRAGWTWQ